MWSGVKNADELCVYIELNVYEYPEDGRKRLNLEAYE